ncbi:hypothetical protein A5784_36580 [Mycobacterium sp. 852013-50091_SCH5140682]|uniref:hypothetical protein n=1 Tax=Mycobacterium sp. 852013-50091_SCH5140682 TaxID=1834109 RepID=UPI0007EABDBC|nr:hypothetical protein [Mycobacterium sp. 852013-50091_SCH5140682]OBC10539.1 hypothetical protein A5784_36580 [Mycobacterium sp. 852013-50091_SCH5140682]
MEQKASTKPHRTVTERVREIDTVEVRLPVLGKVRVQPERLVYYGAVAVLAAAEIIEWPVALLLGVGHALADNHHSKVAQELGSALEEA